MEEFFKDVASEEKETIDYKLLSRQIETLSKKTSSFLHGHLYHFLTTVLENESLDNIKLLQVGFLEDLMNGFQIFKNIKKLDKKYNAVKLYLMLLANQNKTFYGLFLKTPTDKHKNIYLLVQKLFSLKEDTFEKLFNKRIIKNNPIHQTLINQNSEESIAEKTKSESDLKPEFKKYIAEKTKLKTQRLNEIFKKEKTINLELFKYYFQYQSPSNMYNALSDTEDTKRNNIQVNLIKSGLTHLKKDIENVSKNDVNKIEKMNKIADIAELILHFNAEEQKGQGLKISTPNQMLSRLPISLAQLKAGNNSQKLKNKIRQILYSLYRSKNLQRNSIKVRLTLFKHRNNLYEQ